MSEEPLNLVAIGAHPDDVELGCGGTLALAARAGLRTAILDLSAGEAASRGSADERAREARQSATVLRVGDRSCLGLPDSGLRAEDPEQADTLAGWLRRHRPGVVLAPYWEDRHPDHAAAGLLAQRAVFLARLGERHSESRRGTAVLHYMIHQPFEPRFVVDVSETWETKQLALAAFRSQFTSEAEGPATALSDGSFLDAIRARDRWHGAMIGAAYGEGFTSRGPLPIRDLATLLGGLTTASAYSAY